MSNIILPNEWQARTYQRPLFDYLFDGGFETKRAVQVWHRRAGKDSCSLNLQAIASHMRVGTYWHMLPTLQQARKVIWNGIDKYGRRMIDQAFPKEIRLGINESEMMIKLKNGSIWQAVGSDNYDSLVGTNPIGVVFSEYSIADPQAWDYIRPILAENGGFAVFIYTARGKNHGYHLAEMAKHNPKWFYSLLTVEDTTDENGDPIISQETIEDERAAGMDDSTIQQEFYCSFDAAIKGAYYGPLMKALEDKGNMQKSLYEPKLEVITAWDLGMGDSTAIWFAQKIGKEIRMIDFYEASGEGFEHYAKILKEKPYVYSEHRLPHDASVRELGTGQSRLETLRSLGIRGRIVPKLNIPDGIQAVRNILPRCYFDMETCGRGIEALKQYRAEFDEKTKVLRLKPVHDWTSHPSDAFRYFAIGERDRKGDAANQPAATQDYDPLSYSSDSYSKRHPSSTQDDNYRMFG